MKNRPLVSLTILFFMLGFSQAVCAYTILDSSVYAGHTYHLLDYDVQFWGCAEGDAISLGGNLVAVNDAAENQWIFDTFSGTVLTEWANNDGGSGTPSIWLGLTRPIADPNWVWSNGDSFTYSNWTPGEPGLGATEISAGMLVSNAWGTPGKWHDIQDPIVSGLDYTYALVEVGSQVPVPEPTTMLLFGTGLLGLAGISIRRKEK